MHAFICSINKQAKVTRYSGESEEIFWSLDLPRSSLCATVWGSSASSFIGEGQNLLITFMDLLVPLMTREVRAGRPCGCKTPAVRF